MTWRDSSVLINCLTIVMIACLVPHRPLSEHLYLTIATYVFVAFALVNHLFPERLHFLTHVVKAAYTNLIFASVGLGLLWWATPIAISFFDLLPLAAGARWIRTASESIGATARWALIVFGFYLVHFPALIVVAYAVSTAVYFRERRQRIRRHRRFEYGWLHCLEHVAVWLFLLAVNGQKLDLPLVWMLNIGLFGVIVVSLIAAGVVTNLRIFRTLEMRLPPWFDPCLRGIILEKSRANAFSHRLQHYFIKPFSPRILNKRIEWSDIESMVAHMAVRERFDAVVGITSGGAFIARCVAEQLGIESIYYAQSRFWSRMSIPRNLYACFRYYAGMPNDISPTFLSDDVDLSGKRVLLVDDSVCTGVTLASVNRLCRTHGAAEVKTLALFVNPDHSTDYFCRVSKTPLVWPWGWESD